MPKTKAGIAEYRNYYLSVFAQKIIRVSAFKISKKEKKELYTKMQSTEYYQKFLSIGFTKSKKAIAKRDLIVLTLFKRKWFGLMLTLFDLYYLLKGKK